MKKIYDIIDSELIVRTNNVNLTHEFGTVGSSSKITEEGNSTIFTTDFSIEKVVYLTLNGINLIEGKHFYVVAPNIIKISNEGSPIKNNPGLTSNILVAYHKGARVDTSINVFKQPPVVTTFYLNTYSGTNGKLIFDFNIEPNDGTNIHWSILKDGNEVPLFSGNALQTNNGFILDSEGSLVELSHFISETEYLERQGQNIPFTLVVIYDLSQDGSSLDEKLLESVSYHLQENNPITGTLVVNPSFIGVAGASDIIGSYNLTGVLEGIPNNFNWRITRTINDGLKYTIRTGNQASDLSGTFAEIVNPVPGDSFNYRYYLEISEEIIAAVLTGPQSVLSSTINNLTTKSKFKEIATDKVVISVPAVVAIANAGYLDAAIMSYPDPNNLDNLIKIGSLGTQQDLIEYNSRVPREIFTKDVTVDYLSSNEFISAPVNTFGSTVDVVYFVIEVPDSWGPIAFFQALGGLDSTAFNKISLGNGYTAYLYKDAPSTVENPSDYYIKSL